MAAAHDYSDLHDLIERLEPEQPKNCVGTRCAW